MKRTFCLCVMFIAAISSELMTFKVGTSSQPSSNNFWTSSFKTPFPTKSSTEKEAIFFLYEGKGQNLPVQRGLNGNGRSTSCIIIVRPTTQAEQTLSINTQKYNEYVMIVMTYG